MACRRAATEHSGPARSRHRGSWSLNHYWVWPRRLWYRCGFASPVAFSKPMRGRTMIATLQWLGIVPSFSRPHGLQRQPVSEALFRTLKHTPASPRLPFASSDAARRWVAQFVSWYSANIITARFGTSHKINDLPVPTTPFWRVVDKSTNAPNNAGSSGGQPRFEIGDQSAQSAT